MYTFLKTSTKTPPLTPKEATPQPSSNVDRLELNAVFQIDLSKQCAALLYAFRGAEMGHCFLIKQ